MTIVVDSPTGADPAGSDPVARRLIDTVEFSENGYAPTPADLPGTPLQRLGVDPPDTAGPLAGDPSEKPGGRCHRRGSLKKTHGIPLRGTPPLYRSATVSPHCPTYRRPTSGQTSRADHVRRRGRFAGTQRHDPGSSASSFRARSLLTWKSSGGRPLRA